jgi:hypothetical protein
MSWDCDHCSAPLAVDEAHWVVLPRPSDPAELVPVLVCCPGCEPARPLTASCGVGTRAALHDQFEAVGHELGFCWLTLPLGED